jgi:hypothetical protein
LFIDGILIVFYIIEIVYNTGLSRTDLCKTGCVTGNHAAIMPFALLPASVKKKPI